jgi:hypothetical protein
LLVRKWTSTLNLLFYTLPGSLQPAQIDRKEKIEGFGV